MRLSRKPVGSSVQFPAQLAEPFQGQHFRRVDVHIMGFQQGGQLLGIRRVETGMNVINAEAELVAQNAGGTDVGGDHRLFDNAVGNATAVPRRYPALRLFRREQNGSPDGL